MIRPLIVLICIFCVATIMSELVGVGFLWYRGQLTSEIVADIRDILSGQFRDPSETDPEDETSPLSTDDVMEQRTWKVMDLSNREKEMSILKTMVDENAVALSTRQEKFDNKKKLFEEQLETLNAKVVSEASEQARGILLKLPAADAVLNLMELDLEENIVLLKGMSEKKIAELLGEFLKGDQKQVKRGHEIFEALSRGEPAKSLLDQTKKQVTSDQNSGDANNLDGEQL